VLGIVEPIRALVGVLIERWRCRPRSIRLPRPCRCRSRRPTRQSCTRWPSHASHEARSTITASRTSKPSARCGNGCRLIAKEQALWQLDQVINDRGFYTDGGLIKQAIAIATAADSAVQEELHRLTGLNSTNQVDKLIAWLAAHDCEVKDLQKATLSAALRRKALAPEVRRVIELRKEAAHAAANKFQAMDAWRDLDGRVRGTFKYHGAATGRWSASGPQPQNFRKEVENTAAKFAAVMSGDLETAQQLGPPIEIVGDVARAAICAPPGYRLFKGDFTGIESRVLAWLTGQHDKLAQWATFDRTQDLNDDPYFILGRAFGYPEESARKYGKVGDLAFGYGGGVGAYKNFAPEDDDTSDLQIEVFKRAWRDRHPHTVRFWYGCEDAALAAVHRAPQPISYGPLTLQCRRLHDAPFLFIKLPSGRELSYPFVKLIRNDRGNTAITFMDNAIIRGGWSEYRPDKRIWGGTFTENVTQAAARDVLAAAMLRLEAAGYPIISHVHDELVAEVPNGDT
jgi:DNA polymerase